MVDEFEQIRNHMIRSAAQNGRALPQNHGWVEETSMLLDNQRVIMATLALMVRGGHVPIEMARDLQDRAKKITKLLEG